jgi:hypothetical protein
MSVMLRVRVEERSQVRGFPPNFMTTSTSD